MPRGSSCHLCIESAWYHLSLQNQILLFLRVWLWSRYFWTKRFCNSECILSLFRYCSCYRFGKNRTRIGSGLVPAFCRCKILLIKLPFSIVDQYSGSLNCLLPRSWVCKSLKDADFSMYLTSHLLELFCLCQRYCLFCLAIAFVLLIAS